MAGAFGSHFVPRTPAQFRKISNPHFFPWKLFRFNTIRLDRFSFILITENTEMVMPRGLYVSVCVKECRGFEPIFMKLLLLMLVYREIYHIVFRKNPPNVVMSIFQNSSMDFN